MDLGFVHPVSFALAQGERATILMGGKSWDIGAIDWPRKTAYVEPAKTTGRSRWIGTGVSRGYEVCQSARHLLEGKERSLRWSARATERIESMRDGMSWLEPGALFFLRNSHDTTLWTFGGDDINSYLAFVIKQRFRFDMFPDSLAVTIAREFKHKQIEALIASLKNGNDDLDAFPVNEELIDALKFSQCLPRDLARKMNWERMVKKEKLRKILKMSYRIISTPLHD